MILVKNHGRDINRKWENWTENERIEQNEKIEQIEQNEKIEQFEQFKKIEQEWEKIEQKEWLTMADNGP